MTKPLSVGNWCGFGLLCCGFISAMHWSEVHMLMCWQYGRGGAEKLVLPPATQISEEGAGEASTRIERRKAKFKNRPLEKLDRHSASTRIERRKAKFKNPPLDTIQEEDELFFSIEKQVSICRSADASTNKGSTSSFAGDDTTLFSEGYRREYYAYASLSRPCYQWRHLVLRRLRRNPIIKWRIFRYATGRKVLNS